MESRRGVPSAAWMLGLVGVGVLVGAGVALLAPSGGMRRWLQQRDRQRAFRLCEEGDLLDLD